MFGGGGRGPRGRGGRTPPAARCDLETDVHLTFEDAFAGVSTTIAVTGEAACQTCSGSGAHRARAG
jgi:molecular chaperone DnaJ